ncbi:Uncharacterised protein [Vibrio cholerae]|nr:Uncharacterised protein [Vibrio cholerae]
MNTQQAPSRVQSLRVVPLQLALKIAQSRIFRRP